MKDEVGQKKYCIVISIIGLILGIIGFIIEYCSDDRIIAREYSLV